MTIRLNDEFTGTGQIGGSAYAAGSFTSLANNDWGGSGNPTTDAKFVRSAGGAVALLRDDTVIAAAGLDVTADSAIWFRKRNANSGACIIRSGDCSARIRSEILRYLRVQKHSAQEYYIIV